jgi:hypothetical protein
LKTLAVGVSLSKRHVFVLYGIETMQRSTFLRLMLAGLASAPSLVSAAGRGTAAKKLVLIAGKPSHPPMMHEFRAGTILLEKRLQSIEGLTVERRRRARRVG